MPRPKHPRPDANENEVVAELRESGFVVIRTSPLPGNEDDNPLDLFVGKPSKGWPFIQVELKTDIYAEFTTNEIAYLKKVGLWPNPFNQTWRIPIVAATSARGIVDALKKLRLAQRR
jgi:hypothetical protein